MIGVIPAAMATARRLGPPHAVRSVGRTVVMLATLIGTAWVAVTGVVWGLTDTAFSVCTANGFAREHLCWYTPEYSSLFVPLWAADPVGLREVLAIAVIGAVVVTLSITPCRSLVTSVRSLGADRGIGQDAQRRWRW